MSEISANTQNLDAYYTSNQKAQRPLHPVASPPDSLPSVHLFNDRDANIRMHQINQDIYQETKSEEKKPVKNFWIFMGIFVASVLALIGMKSLFKKS